MVRRSPAPLESFDEVLAWLDADREKAAAIYVELREDLSRILAWNQCSDPEGLADEVFDRVSRKIQYLRQSFVGDPRLFFYGVARNLIKENIKQAKAYASLEGADLPSRTNPLIQECEETVEMRAECLDACLQKLTAENRELVVAYYTGDKQAKIDYRQQLAQQLGISMATLRVKVYRIRGSLQRCMVRCLRNMSQQR